MSDTANNKCLIITPFLPKGGVGKTTTTAHLGYALSEYGKTLLVDADPQGNLTGHLLQGEYFEEQEKSFVGFLNKESSFEDSLIEARSPNDTYKGLYLLGTPNNSSPLQKWIQSDFLNSPTQLNKISKTAQANDFKFILFDPPAAFNYYTRYILKLSTHVIPVIQPENFAYEALIDLVKELKDIEDGLDCSLDYNMAIINKFDTKNATHRHYLKEIQESPFDPFFVINDSKSIPYACANSILLQEYKPDNPVNEIFNNCAKYFLNILEKK